MEGTTRHFRLEEGGFLVEALRQRLGNDVVLSIWGGVAHIGAVAMAQSRPSLLDPNRLSATASVFCYVGHKEDEVVKEVSERLAASLGTKVVVVAGLHWDHLRPIEIEQVRKNIRTLVEMILADEKKEGFQ
ncbi:MAG: hypothetical protein HGA84_04260 [Syntrophobacteraceae bacterium]|nr:hypothetical protein [Syntrophobacteraceae bacterium]